MAESSARNRRARHATALVAGVVAATSVGCAGDETPVGEGTTAVTTSPVTETRPPLDSQGTSSTTSGDGRPLLVTQHREYQPGQHLRLTGPPTCGLSPRRAVVTYTGWLADEFAARGALGVEVDLRTPVGVAGFDAEFVKVVASAVHDMAIAVQWLRAHADELCIDPDAIVATGHSFGAIVALTLAYSEGEAQGEPITIDELGGTVTPETVDFGTVPVELASYSDDVDAVVSFAGFALPDRIDAGEPPALLFNGRNDATIPFPLAEATCDAADAVGVVCELVAHDSGHAPAPDRAAAIDRAERFLDRVLTADAG